MILRQSSFRTGVPAESIFGGVKTGVPAKRMFCGADWRIALSAPIFRSLTYAKYAASPEYGGFRALNPNIAVLRTTVKYPGSPRKIRKDFSWGKNRGPPQNACFVESPIRAFRYPNKKKDYPLPAGFPRNRSPLQGTHHFGGHHRRSGTSDGVAATLRCLKLCHLQCARCAKRWRIAGVRHVQPSALTSSPPNLQEELSPLCKFWLGGSSSEQVHVVYKNAPNEEV